MMTFQQFQATGRDVADLREHIADCFDDCATPGRLYHGSACLQPCGDGAFCLSIYNESWMGQREDMERRLYLWCLMECGEDMGVNDALALALVHVENVTGTEALAAIVCEPREEPESCAMLDGACDVNQCAINAWCDARGIDAGSLDVLGPAADGIGDIIGDLYALVSANDFATDDTRANGCNND